MTINKAVILAGGKGSRTRVKIKHKDIIKVMLPIGGKPNLQRNIEILRDRLSIKSISIIVGYGAKVIEDYFHDGNNLGVEIEYIESEQGASIADALLLFKGKTKGVFFVMLADEFYLNFNHEILQEKNYKDTQAIITFKKEDNPHEIKRNYSLNITPDMRVSSLVEKPGKIENNFMGLGSFVFTDSIFEYIEKTQSNTRTGRKELIDCISNMAKGKNVYACELNGSYVNVNTIDDWHFAQFLCNQDDFHKKKRSLVIPSYNEADSISFVIENFKDVVDEIIVADGGSTDGTIEKVKCLKDRCNIKLVQGNFLGYGDAIRNGIEAASGDIITVVEADATFRARDIHKMYEYIKDCDMVVGTRTTRELICQGANMPFWLRVGNVLAAKFIELLWFAKEPRFTDVGCTFRTFWKYSYDEIKHNFISVGPEFSPEMVIEFVRNNKRVIEVPVSYYGRFGGESKHSRGLLGTLKTAKRMFALTLKKRFNLV